MKKMVKRLFLSALTGTLVLGITTVCLAVPRGPQGIDYIEAADTAPRTQRTQNNTASKPSASSERASDVINNVAKKMEKELAIKKVEEFNNDAGRHEEVTLANMQTMIVVVNDDRGMNLPAEDMVCKAMGGIIPTAVTEATSWEMFQMIQKEVNEELDYQEFLPKFYDTILEVNMTSDGDFHTVVFHLKDYRSDLMPELYGLSLSGTGKSYEFLKASVDTFKEYLKIECDNARYAANNNN